MAQLTIDWTTGHEQGISVCGIVVDSRSVRSGAYALAASNGDGIVAEVVPMAGFAVAGVVVTPPDEAAAETIDDLVRDLVAVTDLLAPSARTMRDLDLRIEQDLADRLGDGRARIVTLDGPVDHALDLHFTKRSTDYRLRGTLRYSG
jgi:hypothetical protein